MLDEIFRREKAMKHAKGENDHYPEIYEKWFESKRFQIKTLLEIGVHKGGALRSWLKYFPNSEVYGVDIKDKFDPDKEYDRSRLHFTLGDATDEEFMLSVYPDVTFDVIIDDASHIVEHQWKTFSFMFQRVSPGGVYIIEDTHSSYWPEFNGGFGRNNTFMNKIKTLIDVVNYRAYKKNDRAGQFKLKEEPTWQEKNISSISFYRGLCFIENSKKIK